MSGQPSMALGGEAEAYGPTPAPYLQMLPIRLNVGHVSSRAANYPYAAHAMAATFDAGWAETLVPELTIQKIEVDLTSPEAPKNLGPTSLADQDATIGAAQIGTVEAHCVAVPKSSALARVSRLTLPGLGGATTVLTTSAVDAGAGPDALAPTATGARVFSSAETVIGGLDILGVVHISEIRQIARARSTGRAGEGMADANTEVVGLTVAGIPATVDATGVHAAGQSAPATLAAANAAIKQALANSGMELSLLKPAMLISPNGARAAANAGALYFKFARTFGVPIPGTPQQDVGFELSVGGAIVTATGDAQAAIDTPPISPVELPPVGTPTTVSPTNVAGDTTEIVIPQAIGPTYRTVQFAVRRFEPWQTAGWMLAIIACILGPLLVFRRNPIAATALASPARGYQAFLRYLIRG